MLVRNERVDKHKIKSRGQSREIDPLDPDLLRLADSLLVGQLQQVGLSSDYSLIWGHRRHAAALLKKEITHLDAVVFDQPVTELEFLLMRATENFQRTDLTAFERWLTVKELAAANPGWSNKELAEHLHVDPSMLLRLQSPSKCIPAVQEALKAGKIGISDCYAIGKLPEAEQAGLLALRQSGASRDDIETAGRKRRNGGIPALRVARVRIAMPQGATVVVSGNELGMFEVVELLTDTLKEAKKAAEQFDVSTWVRMMRDKAKG
jgi:ParB family chromosome partitioning protein